MPTPSPFPMPLADFFRDTRSLSPAASGACFDTLYLMQSSSSRGRLTLSAEGWARLWRTTVEHAVKLRTELVERTPYFDVSAEGNADVTLVCRRIVEQETSREATRSRVARYRKRSRNGAGNAESNAAPPSPPAPPSSRAPEPSAPPQAPPLPSGAAPATDAAPKRTRFQAPTLEEVREYWLVAPRGAEKGLLGDPEQFFYYWKARGWRDLRDWKAAAQNWSRKERPTPTLRAGPHAATNTPGRYDDIQSVRVKP
jgi:hypothetical protein